MKQVRTIGWLLSVVSCGASAGWAQEGPETHGAALPVLPVALRVEHADFRSHPASHDVRAVADWAVKSGDHQSLPFVVVDKIHARVFVFNPAGELLGEGPALLGLARGDDGVAGIGERALSQILPSERTTPAGRFMAALDSNLAGQAILWVDYELGISLHPVRSVSARERRLERLASISEKDNRISYGCINVSVAFWQGVVQPTFANTVGVVYVLPETRPLNKVFAM